MPTAFNTSEVQGLIRQARQLQTRAMNDPESVRPRDWQNYRRELEAYVTQNTNNLYDNFVEVEVRRRRQAEPPQVLAAIRDRYQTQWTQTINRAFSTAEDSLQMGEQNQSILQRVAKFIQNLLGIRGTPGIREGGTFSFRGKKYWNYTILYQASTKPVTSVPVSRMVPRVSNVNSSQRDSANLATPVILIQDGNRYLVYQGDAQVAKATQVGQESLPARILTADDLKNAEVVVAGFARSRADRTRTWSMQFASYIQLLFKTIPRNLERDLMKQTMQALDDRVLYLVSGGVISNSAKTCRFVDSKVLTPAALDFVTSSSSLKDHLFHPNCRHRIQPPPPNYVGRIWDEQDIRDRVRNGELR